MVANYYIIFEVKVNQDVNLFIYTVFEEEVRFVPIKTEDCVYINVLSPLRYPQFTILIFVMYVEFKKRG